MIYDLNFRRFIGGLIPEAMRGNLADFIYVMSLPFRSLHFRMLEYRREKLWCMQYNARTVSLEAMLNDYFGDVLAVLANNRRILITEGTPVAGLYLYAEEEHLPLLIGCQQVTDHHTWSAAPYVIKIPNELQGDNDLYHTLDRLASIYELYGTKHTIIYY